MTTYDTGFVGTELHLIELVSSECVVMTAQHARTRTFDSYAAVVNRVWNATERTLGTAKSARRDRLEWSPERAATLPVSRGERDELESASADDRRGAA